MIIFININNIPTPIPIYIYLLQLYFNVTGSILWIDILIIIPATNNFGQIGSSDKKFFRMYATTFYGSLSGNATTATTATKLSTSAGSATRPVYFSEMQMHIPSIGKEPL